MTRIEINDCDDIEKLRQLCLEQRTQMSYISELLVDVSKWHISPELAIEKMRNYLVNNQHKLKF